VTAVEIGQMVGAVITAALSGVAASHARGAMRSASSPSNDISEIRAAVDRLEASMSLTLRRLAHLEANLESIEMTPPKAWRPRHPSTSDE
jgi:hypothetical protein